MVNLAAPKQLELFNSIAQHWKAVTDGGKLLLLSVDGQVLTSANGTSPTDWTWLTQQISSSEPTYVSPAKHQPVLITPLWQEKEMLGYLLALNAKKQQRPLIGLAADILVSRLADSQAIQDMTDELIGAWDQLELIYRVTENIALTSDLAATLQSILQEIQTVTLTGDSFILLRHPNSLLCVTSTDKNDTQVLCDETLLNNLIKANRVILCNDKITCKNIWPEMPKHVDNLLATQLNIIEEDAEAAIGLINKANKNFTAGDVKLLAALAQQVATIIKNFLTHQKLIVEERLSRELEIAAEIQESLLPTKLPQVGGLSIAVTSVPASEVGGDFYDFITLDDRHLTLIIGDVAGKGIPAAMLTSVTRTMLRVEAMRGEEPHKIIQQANNVLHQDLSRADSFVTAFVATIDSYAGTITYASAGHTPTLLWRAETHQVEQLKATTLPIGIVDEMPNSSVTVDLHSGDTVVFYTDGITEAQAPNQELFGLERLIYIIESRATDPPEKLQQYIQSEVVKFWRHSSGRDDATLLIVKTLSQAEIVTPQNISTLVEMVEFNYPASMDYLSEISQQISDICRKLPALPVGSRGDDFIYLIELAISEICTNIVKHAYAGRSGNITGHITLLNNGVQLDFFDKGQGFDPNSIPEPKSDPNHLVEGGYGLHIVRQIMDVVSYESQPDEGNHWHLIKFVSG